MPPPDALQTTLADITLRNPVLLAAGTNGTLDEFADVLDLSRIGGVISKSITPKPRDGNETWRIIEHRAGMLNAIGLANPGIERFAAEYLPRAANMPCAVIGSVAGFGVDDYVNVCEAMNRFGRRPRGDGQPASPTTASSCLDAIELNVSCPNVKTGCNFALSAPDLRELVVEVMKVCTRTRLIVKLSPMVSDLGQLARAAIDAGADALTISNTMPAMAIDVHTRKPRLANITGGLSGPAIHPAVTRLIYETHKNVCKDARGKGSSVPIIGAGGVLTWEDAAEFILAGASAVQVGTGLFVDPRSPLKIAKGLEKWVRSQGCASIVELIGAIKT